MPDSLQITFDDAVKRVASELAGMSGVDLANVGPDTRHLWETRGLALHHLATGDMAGALKVMDAARPASRPSRPPVMNQPCTAAKETR